MKNPFVSVVIPVRNAEQTLINCLNSIITQSYDNYEVIVVDNQSFDNSKNIILNYKNIKYIYNNLNTTRAKARNLGINCSEGEIVIMTDSDCIVPFNWIKQMIDPIVNENENVVMGGDYDLMNSRWTKVIQNQQGEYFKNYIKEKYISMLDTKNWAVRREVIRKYMFDEEMLNVEDAELALRLRKKEKIRYLPEVKVGHFHKTTLLSWAKVNLRRGIWVNKIYQKHKQEVQKIEPLFNAFGVKGFLIFPFWSIIQFFKRPFDQALFLLVSESSWRIGILIGRLRF